jgi:TolB-like protein/tetratricopeptide (TPR) repeat protein
VADSLFAELKRRNVFKIGVAYLVLAWVVIQVTSEAVPALRLPEWVNTFVFFIGTIGFPFALFFAWAFEITPDGIKKGSEISPEDSVTTHTGRKLDFIIIGLMAVALGYFIYESRFESQPDDSLATKETSTKAEPESTKEILEEPEPSSIAVLPFVNMSSDKEQEYFSDGLSEEILNLLVQNPQLRVIARTSSFSFKGKDITVSDVAKELNVTHVLEGSVRNSGSKLRITAQLIRTSDSSHLWSHTYDKEITDVFAVQDEIAKAVVAAMEVTLVPEQQAFNTDKTTNIDAYKLYLRSRSLLVKRGKTNLNQALKLLDAATIIDPAFADAFAAKAQIYSIILNFDPSWSKDRVTAEAEKAISITLDINPKNVEAIVARATVQFFINTDWRLAEKNLLIALELQPNNLHVHNFLGDYYSFTLNIEKALFHEKRARELDPISLVHIFDLASVYSSSGNRAKQIELLYSTLPNFSLAFDYLTMELLAENKIEEAKNLWNTKSNDLSYKENIQIVAMLKLIEMIENKNQNYDNIPHEITQALELKLFSYLYVGRVFIIRDEVDNALKYYNKSYQLGEAYIRHISYTGTRTLFPDNEGWQAFWNLSGMKELEAIRLENTHLGSATE